MTVHVMPLAKKRTAIKSLKKLNSSYHFGSAAEGTTQDLPPPPSFLTTVKTFKRPENNLSPSQKRRVRAEDQNLRNEKKRPVTPPNRGGLGRSKDESTQTNLDGIIPDCKDKEPAPKTSKGKSMSQRERSRSRNPSPAALQERRGKSRKKKKVPKDKLPFRELSQILFNKSPSEIRKYKIAREKVARREYYGNLVTMRYGEYVEWKKEQRPQTSRKSQESLRSPSLDELPVEPSLVQVESDTSSEIVEDVERKMSESLPALSPKPSPRSSMDDRTPSDLLMGMSPLTTPGEEGSVTVEPLPIKSHRSGKKTKGDTLQLQEIYQQRRDMRLANMKRVVEAKRNQGKNKEKEEVESVQSELDQTNPEQNTFVENSTKS